MSISGWADFFIDPRGKGRLFIAKEKTLAEWYEMMEKLRQLLLGALAGHDDHLLGLTKNAIGLKTYLAKKEELLADRFIIKNWELP